MNHPNRAARWLTLPLLGLASTATVLAGGVAARAAALPNHTAMPTMAAPTQTHPMAAPMQTHPMAAPVQSARPAVSPTTEAMASLSHYSPQTAPILRVGSHGQVVKDVQAKLEQEKLYTASIDGVYGRNTQQAVKTFQRNHHLTPDGIIGHRTWTALVNS